MTGEPYAYASNNPVNYIDPTGLFSLRDAWDATGGKAVSAVASVGKQDVANFAGGVLNTITFGNEERINSWLGQEDRVRRESGWYTGGEVAGLAAPAGALKVGASAVRARGAAPFGDAAYRSRWLGADSFLFGNSSLGVTARSGLLNPAGRGSWRLGWSVNGQASCGPVPGFRLKAPGLGYKWLFNASGF